DAIDMIANVRNHWVNFDNITNPKREKKKNLLDIQEKILGERNNQAYWEAASKHQIASLNDYIAAEQVYFSSAASTTSKTTRGNTGEDVIEEENDSDDENFTEVMDNFHNNQMATCDIAQEEDIDLGLV